jgi:hypothetical protein
MYQQQLDLQFPLTQQLGLDLDALITTIDGLSSDNTMTSYLTVSNSNGAETARIDDTGISLRMENQTWLKTKVANWLGVKYL